MEFVPDPELTEREVAECIRYETGLEATPGDTESTPIGRDAFAEKVVNSNVS